MNRPRQIFAVVLFISTLLLTGCGVLDYFTVRLMTADQQRYTMIALVNGQNVTFTLLDEKLADKDIKFMLYGIGVSRRDPCAEDCTAWVMVRPIDSNIDLVEENFVTPPIKFGVTLPNMQTRVYKALRKGQYSASAGFALIKDGKEIGRKQVVAEFTIE